MPEAAELFLGRPLAAFPSPATPPPSPQGCRQRLLELNALLQANRLLGEIRLLANPSRKLLAIGSVDVVVAQQEPEGVSIPGVSAQEHPAARSPRELFHSRHLSMPLNAFDFRKVLNSHSLSEVPARSSTERIPRRRPPSADSSSASASLSPASQRANQNAHAQVPSSLDPEITPDVEYFFLFCSDLLVLASYSKPDLRIPPRVVAVSDPAFDAFVAEISFSHLVIHDCMFLDKVHLFDLPQLDTTLDHALQLVYLDPDPKNYSSWTINTFSAQSKQTFWDCVFQFHIFSNVSSQSNVCYSYHIICFIIYFMLV